MMRLTRQYRFSASHRLHSRQLSEAENQEIFGKCNNPYGHGHDYVLRVTVSGAPDLDTGLLVRVGALDALVEEKVLRYTRDRNLNDWEVFADTGTVPTTENLAAAVTARLSDAWTGAFPAGPRLNAVTILETRRNTVETRIAE